MKKWVLAFSALVLALALAVPGMAQDEGVIVQSACSIVRSGEYYLVYCFAQVHNNSDSIICLDEGGSFDLHSGEQILSTSQVSRLWPYFINPGEDGYLFDIVPFEPNENGVVVPSVTGISYNLKYMTIPQAHGGYALDAISSLEYDAAGDLIVTCELINPTQMDAYDPAMAFGLYTQEGSMIYADGVTLQDVGVKAGGSVLLRFRVEDVFVEQWKAYGAQPAQVRVNAMFRMDED